MVVVGMVMEDVNGQTYPTLPFPFFPLSPQFPSLPPIPSLPSPPNDCNWKPDVIKEGQLTGGRWSGNCRVMVVVVVVIFTELIDYFEA